LRSGASESQIGDELEREEEGVKRISAKVQQNKGNTTRRKSEKERGIDGRRQIDEMRA